MITGKTIALTVQTFVSKVMPQLFNTLSMFLTGKESACNAGDPGSIPRSGRSPGEGIDNSLQYTCLENCMDREAWWATVHEVAKSWTWLSDYHIRFVKAFLPISNRLLISWLQSPSAVILEPKKIKSVTVSIVSPSICNEVMGLDAMILVFWMLSFKPAFSFSSFTFITRLFSFSLLSAIRVVSSAYLRLLIFLPAILIPACALSSPLFRLIDGGKWKQ